MHRKMVEGERESIKVLRSKTTILPWGLSFLFARFFSLMQKAQRKKAWQKKEMPFEVFRALRSATKGAAFGICDLLKKVDQNFDSCNAW